MYIHESEDKSESFIKTSELVRLKKKKNTLKEAFHRGRVRTDHGFKVLNEFEVIKQYRKHKRGGVCPLRVAPKFVFEHAEFGNSKKI